MAKRENTLSLADQFDLSDLEPGVDRDKAAAYLADDLPAIKPKATPKRQSTPTEAVRTNGNARVEPTAKQQPAKPDPWTSRTIRIRQSTATALTKAACTQRTKQAEGKLVPSDPLTVQEIADLGIRLALSELGYLK